MLRLQKCVTPSGSLNYGKEITKLVQACYLAAEKGQTLKWSNPIVQQELEQYESLISKGEGAEVLFR